MKQAVRNYLKRENSTVQKNSMVRFTTIETIPFIDYLAKVLSIFENKEYNYQIFNVKDDKKIYDNDITVCIIYNNKKINANHLNTVNKYSLIEYIASTIKDRKDFVYFEIKDNDLPLLDENLNVNLSSLLIKKFPYLKDIIYDLIAHKYENAMNNKPINYSFLTNKMKDEYAEEISARQQFLKEEEQKLNKEDQERNHEINEIINFIEQTKLDEGTKKILIYTIDKYSKKGK